MRPIVLLVVALTAGCAAPSPVAPEETLAETATVPVVVRPDSMVGLLLDDPAQGLHFSPAVATGVPCWKAYCYETTVAADPEGRIFVSGVIAETIAVSSDGGATFAAVARPSVAPIDPDLEPGGVGSPRILQNDALVQVAPDGTLYFSALLTKAAYGAFGFQQVLFGIQVAASEDAGETWAVNNVITVDDDPRLLGADRQWLAFGQDGIVYVSFQHTEGLGILVARSDDGGRTLGPFVNAIENTPADGYIGGPPTVDASGRLFVPHFFYAGITIEAVVPRAPGALRVAWSDDGGETFAVADVHRPEAGSPGAFFPVMVEDARGAMHLAWWNYDEGVLIASSLDRGATWTTPVRVGPEITAAYASPWLLAHDDVLDVVWFAGAHDADSADLLITRIPLGSGAAAAATLGHVTGYESRGGNTDFAHATLLPDGRVVAVLGDIEFEDARIAIEATGEARS